MKDLPKQALSNFQQETLSSHPLVAEGAMPQEPFLGLWVCIVQLPDVIEPIRTTPRHTAACLRGRRMTTTPLLTHAVRLEATPTSTDASFIALRFLLNALHRSLLGLSVPTVKSSTQATCS